ncbi:hypothetical protein [Polycladidibacter stylochi]|uniref:hypothetical protein n=1 Tax=Polycladidibacter stylochi TaxID=1807766 RepID=UPI00083592EB|nr:hypothetical protein [Pseudovibrio stylochi]
MPLSKAEKRQISDLCIGFDGKQRTSDEDFLRNFRGGISDPISLGVELLSDALTSKTSGEVQSAMIVGFSFGFAEVHIKLLSTLAPEAWHVSHEDIASAFDEIRTPSCVNSLKYLAQWVPDYLDFDEARALGSKAVWALSKIGDPSAIAALQEISISQKDHIGKLAQEKLLELGVSSAVLPKTN